MYMKTVTGVKCAVFQVVLFCFLSCKGNNKTIFLPESSYLRSFKYFINVKHINPPRSIPFCKELKICDI